MEHKSVHKVAEGGYNGEGNYLKNHSSNNEVETNPITPQESTTDNSVPIRTDSIVIDTQDLQDKPANEVGPLGKSFGSHQKTTELPKTLTKTNTKWEEKVTEIEKSKNTKTQEKNQQLNNNVLPNKEPKRRWIL